jgi:TRAP-type C4-dicarboxylate transport system substrate-binding protein
MDEIRQELLKKTKNIRLLGAGNLGRWRSFFTTKKQVKTAADLKGLKIRVIPDAMQVEMVKFLGGNPTPMPWPEVYTSLASGVIDGLNFEVYLLRLYKLDEFTKFGVLDNHSYMWSMIAASDKWLKSLPKDLQEIVVDGVSMTINVVNEYAKAVSLDARQAFEKDSGGTIYVPTAEEMATFRAAREPMMEWYKKNVEEGDLWLEKLLKAIKEAEAAVNEKRSVILQ